MIIIEVNTSGVDALLGRIIALGKDTTPVARALAGVLADIPERAFASQSDSVTGEPWAALSPATVARRGSAQPILQVSGILAGSIHSEYGPDFARVGTADVKAASRPGLALERCLDAVFGPGHCRTSIEADEGRGRVARY